MNRSVMTSTNPSLLADRQITEVVTVTLHINDRDYRVEIEPRVTLLDLLRERLELTGSKKGCGPQQFQIQKS